jgi:signal transduction histidine kinase
MPAARFLSWCIPVAAPIIVLLYAAGWRLSATYALAITILFCFLAGRTVDRLKRENRALSQRVIAADQMKKDFISHASHELKAPLASMQEKTHLILEKIPGPLTEKQSRLLDLNLQSGKRLSAMIGNLLDLSRLDAGIVDYDMRSENVGSLAEGVLRDLAPQARDKSLRVVSEIAGDSLITVCDPNRIRQILTNLIDNAIRFSAKGGVVTVTLKPLAGPPPDAPRQMASRDESILIAVADSGPGIE